MTDREPIDDDDAYVKAVQEFVSGIDGMLEEGATVADVRAEFEALIRGRE